MHVMITVIYLNVINTNCGRIAHLCCKKNPTILLISEFSPFFFLKDNTKSTFILCFKQPLLTVTQFSSNSHLTSVFYSTRANRLQSEHHAGLNKISVIQ